MSGRSIPAILGRDGDFQELGHRPLFDPYGQSWNCHGACGCVIQLADVSLLILRLKVQWKKSTCPPSWIHLVLISLCHVLGLCHSFKGCALPPSLLFHSPLRDFTPIFLWEAEGRWSVFCNCFKAEQGCQPCLSGSKNLWMPDLGAPGTGKLLVKSVWVGILAEPSSWCGTVVIVSIAFL